MLDCANQVRDRFSLSSSPRRRGCSFSLKWTCAAEILGVGRPALSAVLNGRASLSPEMAIRVEKAFGVSMDLLLKIQLQYDIARARGSWRRGSR